MTKETVRVMVQWLKKYKKWMIGCVFVLIVLILALLLSGRKTNPLESSAQNTEAAVTFSCTISISCASILNHMDTLDSAKAALVPSDGVILGTTTVTVTEGESVYDVLRRTCTDAGIPLDASIAPAYGTAYVRGINNIYEFDCGSVSGWKYYINGTYTNYGCSTYILKEGDSIQWDYSCD